MKGMETMSDQHEQHETHIENEDTLTTRQGHPVTNNQNIRTVGNRGPATLENYDFIEKISHFDREKIPERIVHARGAGAHGYFETYGTVGDEPVSKYTRAKVFQGKGKKTPVFARFSTVVHGIHSPETVRDPRGCCEILYRRRQLGSRREQSKDIFYPRCHEIPRYDPCIPSRSCDKYTR